MIGHTAPISCVASHASEYIATAGYDNRVILWDQKSRMPLSRGWHDHLANQCAFSPDGKFLVSASSDHSARIWALPEMQLVCILNGHDDDVEMASFSPDGEYVATASRDHKVRVFSVNGTCLKELSGHKADVLSVVWEPCGRFLHSSSDDGTLKRWDWVAGKVVNTLDLGDTEVDTLAFGAQGRVFVGDDRGQLTIIEGEKQTSIQGHNAGVKRVVADPKSGAVTSVSYDRTLAVWEPHGDGKLRLRKRLTMPDVIWPRSCSFRDNENLLFATFGTSFASCNLNSGEFDTSLVSPTWGFNAVCSHQDKLYAIGDAGRLVSEGKIISELGSLCNFLTPCGDLLLSGGQNGKVFNALDGATLFQHRSPLNCAATFLVDGVVHAAIGSYTGDLLIFAVEQNALTLRTRIRAHRNAIKGVASNDGVIFTVCAAGDAAMHDAQSFERLDYRKHGHSKIANGCVALADGRFASVSRDRQLRIWKGIDCEVIATPHTHSIKCIAGFGTLIATGSYNGRVAVFDSELGDWVTDSKISEAGISSICSTDHGFVASSYDGALHPLAEASLQ